MLELIVLKKRCNDQTQCSTLRKANDGTYLVQIMLLVNRCYGVTKRGRRFLLIPPEVRSSECSYHI